MLNRFNQRYNITGYLILLYITTALLISFYSRYASQSWKTLAFGLFICVCGSLANFFILKRWELTSQSNLKTPKLSEKTRPLPADISSLEFDSEEKKELTASLFDLQIKHRELIDELNKTRDSLHQLEIEKGQFQQRIDDVYQEFNTYKSSTEEELQRKTVLLLEYQETVNQQREVIKKRQDQIGEFETKVRDLNYEVKTLLQLADYDKDPIPKQIESPIFIEKGSLYNYSPDQDDEESYPLQENHVKTSEEASTQLKRCIDIAQKITGANHLNNETSRFRDLSIDNFTLDLRRLFDNLRSENACTVVVYSQKENKLLFANNQAKSLLGWSIEKFVQNFQEIAKEGDLEWKKGLSQLSTLPESRMRLMMKTKTGQNLLVHCHLGVIPRGIFRNHVIGVLYPA